LFGNWLAIVHSRGVCFYISFRYSTKLHLGWTNSLLLICKYFI